MEEIKDFVIDTGMPIINSPVSDENQTDDSKNEESKPIEETSPVVVEESTTEAVTLEVLQSELKESQGPEEVVLPKNENGPTLTDIAVLIEALQKKFDEKIAVDEHKNSLFDKLYKERDEYKNDLYGKLLKPFIMGSIEIINDLRMYISKMDSYDVERSLNYLKTFPDDIIEMLENNGVELYTEDGEYFNPKMQRAKRTVPTDDAALNNTIAERIEKGYSWNGVILRPEIVAVYKLK